MRKIRLLSVLFALIFVFTLLPIPLARATYTGIFEDFDSGTVGSLPDGWVRYGAAAISSDVSVSSNNSFKVDGVSGGAACVYKTITAAPEHAVVEADVYPVSSGEAGSLSLMEVSGKWQARVVFINKQICYSDIGHDDQHLHVLTSYTENTWYHVKIVHDHTAKTFDVYIDDTLVGDDIAMYTSGDPTPTRLVLSSGNDSGSDLIYFDNVKLYSLDDTTKPILSGYSAWRSDESTATLRFSSNEAGGYSYEISESVTVPINVITTGSSVGAIGANIAVSRTLAMLTSGAKYVYFAVEDAVGNVSDPLTVPLPYDYYYHEDFESYPLNTSIASGAMSPLAQRNSGSGSSNQKIIANGSGKVLSLTSDLNSASDQQILLDASALAAADSYVFEGDVYPLLDTGFQLRFSFADSNYEGDHEAGVFFNGGKITTATKSGAVELKSSYTANEWHHVKIVATPISSTYAVYMDGDLLSDTLPLPPGINRLAISAGNLANNTTAYYDNLEFYLAPALPDTTAPALTGSSVWRSGDTTATVSFASEEAGACYYQITDSATPPPDVMTGGTDGGSVTADAANKFSLAGLTAGDKYLHIVVADGSGNVSKPLTVPLPYDYYYHEDFESYPLNTYIASNNMSPLSQQYSGNGDINQKVAAKVDGSDERMLSLSSTSSWASGHIVSLDETALAAAGKYVLEGDVFPLGTSNKQLRFCFSSGPDQYKNEAGVIFGENGNILSCPLAGNDFIDLDGDYSVSQWYHIKIEAYPSSGIYSVYVNGTLLDDSLPLPDGITCLYLNAVSGNTAYFDNIKFYLVPEAARSAVTFNENDGDSPSESRYYIADDSADFYTAATGGSLHTLTSPTRTGYVFGGWYKEATCTNQIISDTLALSEDSDYTDAHGLWNSEEDVTLYAKWLESSPSGLAIDYETETITGLATEAEYGIEGTSITSDDSGKAQIQSAWFGEDIGVVKKGSLTNRKSFDSVSATLSVPGRPVSPSGFSAVEETATGAEDGSITGVNDSMEYRLSTDSDWTPVDSEATEIESLGGGVYYVRYKAVSSGTPAFASEYASVTVGTILNYGSLQFEAGSYGTYEGYNGWIGVERIGGSDGEVSVSYSMSDGTALAGTHYAAASGTLTWTDGDSNRKVIPFTVYNDSTYNGYLSMTCTLSNPTGGAILGTQNPLDIRISDNDAPPTPTGLTAAAGIGKVSLSWDSVKDAYYKVYCSQTSGGFTEADLVTSVYDGTSYTVTGLKSGRTYYFAVKSGHNIYYSEFSAEVSVIPNSRGGSSGGGGTTNPDIPESIEIISLDGGTSATGALSEIENGVSISIPSAQVELLAGSEQSVTLETDTLRVSFNAAAVDYIDSAAGSDDVVLTVVRAEPSALSEENRRIIGDRPVYDFSLTTSGNAISSLGGGTATISIPYTLESSENPNAIIVYYVDDSGAPFPVSGRYNTETGMVEFTTEHFSRYAVAYNYVSFVDVAESAWYYDAVTFCAARGITHGTGNGNFSPDTSLTRSQFLVLLMRAYGIASDNNSSDNFSDAGDTYYTGYLSAAKRLDISNGVGNNLFAPDDEITRQDMFTLIYRALDVLGELPEREADTTIDNFDDTAEISDYALTAMNTLIKAGIIFGTDGRLVPLGTSSRAEMAQVLLNLFSQ